MRLDVVREFGLRHSRKDLGKVVYRSTNNCLGPKPPRGVSPKYIGTRRQGDRPPSTSGGIPRTQG
jgi:hypothetical protein